MAQARRPTAPQVSSPSRPTPAVKETLVPRQLITGGVSFNPQFVVQSTKWRKWTSMQWKGTTTDPAIGNGNIEGWYKIEDGRWLELWVEVTMGSTTTYGTGSWYFTGAPVPPSSGPIDPIPNIGWAGYRDASAPANYAGPILLSGTQVLPRVPSITTAGQVSAVSSAAPFTWATSDILNLYAKFRYVSADTNPIPP